MTNLMQYQENVRIVMYVAYGKQEVTPYPDGSAVTRQAIIGRDETGGYWQFEETQIRKDGFVLTSPSRGYLKLETLPDRNNPYWWFNPAWSE